MRDMSFGVYVHFPWCLAKCPYCDFASVAGPPPHARYARAIARELDLRRAQARDRVAISLYVGGGTPSLWEPESLAETVSTLGSHVDFIAGAEMTLEANPGASDAARFAHVRAAGFNRISIGVQSLHDATLATLGRRHSAAEAVRAVEAARQAGFAQVAIDLLYGASDQDVAMARADAIRAVALQPEHLSCYALTLDSLAIDVPMARAVREGRLRVPDSDLQWEMGQAIGEVLAGAGYERYEISNWAKAGHRARHNTLYWTGGEYLGLGCGACGFALHDPRDPARGGRRWANHRDPAQYLADIEEGRAPEAWAENLDASTLLRERLAMGLRQVEGVDVERACASLGQDPRPVLAAAQGLSARGLATIHAGVVALTERGLDLHSEAVLAFV